MVLKLNCVLLFIYLFFSSAIFSQDNGRPLDVSKAEKIYLQLGSGTYTLDEEIWFKAIVTNDENHIPTELSGVLYVDLIGPNERIMAHKLVKLAHGIGHGSFELPEDALPGRYLVRAYTQWNLNFGSEFMFRAYIDLYTALNDRNKSPIEGLVLVERKLDNNGYGLRHTETIVLNDTATDLQFFPESGSMVHGFRNKIGFKAMGMDGRGKEVQGTVFGAKGDTAAHFKSNRLGMGIFFMEADSSTTYYAKLLSDNMDSLISYPLPKVVPKGSILSVTKTGDKIRIRITSNGLADRVAVKASCRGIDHYLIEGRLREGQSIYELPAEQLPEGIIVFTLMDEQHIPVAERLYFNESDRDRLDIALAMDKDRYGRRAESGLDIQVSGNRDIPPMVDFSVMVINKDHRGQETETIRSYFLLSSELRGEVEDPGRYFRDEDPNRSNDLDALLLTQGWRNYKYPVKRQGAAFYWPQRGLSIKGRVRSTFPKNRPAEGVDMTLATFGIVPSFYAQTTDSLGRFHFLLDDAYGKQMRILLQATKGEGKKANYTLFLDTLSAPKVVYTHRSEVRKPDKIVETVVAAQKRRHRAEIAFDSLYGVTQLKEVIVEGYRITPERERAYKEFGEPDVIIPGDEIRKKEKKWSYGLYSILLFNYGDQIQIEEFSDGFTLAHIRGGRGEPTLLVVDGRLLRKGEYEFAPHIPAENVESVELIKYAKFFKKQYLSVFPETHPLDAPSLGHVISIYTKGGSGIHGLGRPLPGTLGITIEVLSPEKEFYAPKYDKPAIDQRPDLRSLIHWVPSIRPDRSGKASVRFYNGDITGDYIIIVEAISGDGRIGYQEKIYRVQDQD